LKGKCPLCHEGEEGRDHEGDAADEIGERDPPGQTLMAKQSATLKVASPALAEALQSALSLVPKTEGQIVAQREIVTAIENAWETAHHSKPVKRQLQSNGRACLHRDKENRVASAAAEIQHMQQALQQMNLHLHHVVSDITGETGLRILDAILAGQREPKELVKLRDKRCSKSTPQQMQAALVGDYRPEHLSVLKRSLEAYRFYQSQIEECDRQIEPLLLEQAQRVEAASAQLQLAGPESKAGEPGQKLAEKQQQQQSDATEPNTNA
jgi:hypothetical protein